MRISGGNRKKGRGLKKMMCGLPGHLRNSYLWQKKTILAIYSLNYARSWT